MRYLGAIALISVACLLSQCGNGKTNTQNRPKADINLENLLSGKARPFTEREISRAIKILEKAEPDGRDEAEIENQLGLLYAASGDLDSAIVHMKKSIDLHEDYGKYRFLASFYYAAWKSTSDNKDKMDGLAALEKLLSLREDRFNTVYDVAKLYENFDECAKATETYKKTLELVGTYERTYKATQTAYNRSRAYRVPIEEPNLYSDDWETVKKGLEEDIQERIDIVSANCEAEE